MNIALSRVGETLFFFFFFSFGVVPVRHNVSIPSFPIRLTDHIPYIYYKAGEKTLDFCFISLEELNFGILRETPGLQYINLSVVHYSFKRNFPDFSAVNILFQRKDVCFPEY